MGYTAIVATTSLATAFTDWVTHISWQLLHSLLHLTYGLHGGHGNYLPSLGHRQAFRYPPLQPKVFGELLDHLADSPIVDVTVAKVFADLVRV